MSNQRGSGSTEGCRVGGNSWTGTEQGTTLDPRDSSGGQLGDPRALKALGPFRELEGEWPVGHKV